MVTGRLAKGCSEKFSTRTSSNAARSPENGIGRSITMGSRASGSTLNPKRRSIAARSRASVAWPACTPKSSDAVNGCDICPSASASTGPFSDTVGGRSGIRVTIHSAPPAPLIASDPPLTTSKLCDASLALPKSPVRPDTVSATVKAPISPYRRRVTLLPCGTDNWPGGTSAR